MIFKHCVKRATLENSKWPSSHILGKLIYKARRRYIPIFWHQLSIPKGHQIFYICFKIQLAVTLPSATDARPPAVSSLRTKKSQITIRKNCKKVVKFRSLDPSGLARSVLDQLLFRFESFYKKKVFLTGCELTVSSLVPKFDTANSICFPAKFKVWCCICNQFILNICILSYLHSGIQYIETPKKIFFTIIQNL